ncbi:unnamed protein product [Agarophyton chilense]
MERRKPLNGKRMPSSKSRKRKRPLFQTLPALAVPQKEQPKSSQPKSALNFQHDSILRVSQLPDGTDENAEEDQDVSDYSSSPPLSPQQSKFTKTEDKQNSPPIAPSISTSVKDCVQLKSGSAGAAKYVILRVGPQPVPISGSVWISVAHGSARVFGQTFTSDSDPVLLFSAPYAPFILTIASLNIETSKQRRQSVQRSNLHPDALTNNRIRQSLQLSEQDTANNGCILVLSSTSSDHQVWEAADSFQVSADLRISLREFNEVAGHPSISPGEELVDGMSIYPRTGRFGSFREWPEWNSVCCRLNDFLNQAVQPHDLRLLVCGGSGSGKSTFTRCIINHLLQSCRAVVLMDSDVGQSEMSPPGLVAAYCVTEMRMGSGAASNRNIPLAARFFGDTTPREDPDQYALYIELVCKEALEFAAEHKYPVVINSDGWTNGIGADLLHHLTTKVDPSHLAQLSLQGHEPRRAIVELASNFREDRCFLLTTPRSERDMCFPPILLRELHVASYFSKELAMGRVYNVHIEDVELICVDEKSLSGMPMEGLRAFLVALGRNVMVDDQTEQDWNIEGFGIVRGCDPETGFLYICTPVCEEKLELCDTLLYSGGAQLPQALFFSSTSPELLKSRMVPFILAGSVHTAEAMRSRGTLARK